VSTTDTPPASAAPAQAFGIPIPVLIGFRGIGQVFFQENALSGLLFLAGLIVSSPIMALGGLVGAAIGPAVAWGLKFDKGELNAGIYGFNSTLVGIATFFFFAPGAASSGLLVAGCVVATVLTRIVRQYVPFPTYTGPFVVTTWVVFVLGKAMGAPASGPEALLVPVFATHPVIEATAHGIGQVMFQASIWTGLLFLAGIAVGDRHHAAWVLVGSIIGMLVASYHVDAAMRSLDPERLVERSQFDNVKLGLFGYNATLAAVALYLWRKSLIPPVLGILFSVPLTELIPLVGLPALTAPFVLATWLVLALGWLESKWLKERASPA
jgi:urea transporter